jgi:Flp pilus assembly protein protease CpaA
MAFATSSDLLTMTISNRLSMALAGGFFLLTLVRYWPFRPGGTACS